MQAAGLDDPAAVHARLSAALAYWHGPAFQEFTGLPWADLEASRLAELRLAAIEHTRTRRCGWAVPRRLVASLDRLAAEHPLREEAWRLLALALYQSGRQGDALAALRRARARLAADLGVDPGPALRALEDGILAQAPHLSAPPAALPRRIRAGRPCAGRAILRPRSPQPYVGRDAELSQVHGRPLEAAAGRTRIVLVTGDAGAGKTALASQVSQRLAGEGWTGGHRAVPRARRRPGGLALGRGPPATWPPPSRRRSRSRWPRC